MRDITTSAVESNDEQWADVENLERIGSVATAAALLAFGISRRSVPGAVAAAAAIPLAYRGIAGHWPPWLAHTIAPGAEGDTRAMLTGERGLHVRESISVERPISEVYRFWRQLEHLPRFMRHLKSVTPIGDAAGAQRYHWVAKGPLGVNVEWDAEVINEAENQLIAWRSLPHSDVVSAGSVNFNQRRGGRSTVVSVHLQYAPPAGRLGRIVSATFGREPSQTIREDMRRFKQILEAGEITRASIAQVGGSR